MAGMEVEGAILEGDTGRIGEDTCRTVEEGGDTEEEEGTHRIEEGGGIQIGEDQ